MVRLVHPTSTRGTWQLETSMAIWEYGKEALENCVGVSQVNRLPTGTTCSNRNTEVLVEVSNIVEAMKAWPLLPLVWALVPLWKIPIDFVIFYWKCPLQTWKCSAQSIDGLAPSRMKSKAWYKTTVVVKAYPIPFQDIRIFKWYWKYQVWLPHYALSIITVPTCKWSVISVQV